VTDHAIATRPTRSVVASSASALGALLLRDLIVLRKHPAEFALRTLIQPFLLCFVFLYVFPKIGQGIGGTAPSAQSHFATVLVPGVVGISVMFQGVQSIALAMAQEFGYTREIEDRVQAPCPIWLVAVAKVISGAAQGLLAAAIVLPIAAVVHAPGVEAHLTLHWPLIVTLVPLSCVAMAGLGLVLGTSFEPRVEPPRSGDDRWLALAAGARPAQPADLRQRGDARRVHRCAAPVVVHRRSGAARIRDRLPGARAAQLPPPRALVGFGVHYGLSAW
jgi:hypothetical protein